MANIFQQVLVKKPKRSSHNLSYSTKLDLDFGNLCPMLMEKVVPSDKFYLKDEFMCRFAPFFGQVFQAMKLCTEYFFVPSRLLWKNFEMFLSNGLDGRDSSFVHPYISMKKIQGYFTAAGASLIGTLFDYFNLATAGYESLNTEDIKIDALPFYAYCKSFIDWYADENLDYMPIIAAFETGLEYAVDGDNTDRVLNLLAYLHSPVLFTDFNDFLTYYNSGELYHGISGYIHDICAPLVRSYPKDYFTSALPFAQRGPIVQIPLNGEGDVKVLARGLGYESEHYHGVGIEIQPGEVGSEVDVALYPYGGAESAAKGTDVNKTIPVFAGAVDANPSTITNPSDADKIMFRAVNINGTATITDLRTAFAVQNWLEKRARAGARPKEQIFASFGVKTKDYRLDRSEFISAFTSTVKIGEVFTTAQNDDGSFVPGLGVSVGQLADSSRRWKKFVPEHGYIFGNVSCYPVASYSQGVPRQFLELDVMDYFWPEFQHIGEQPIFNCELKVRGTQNYSTFGYTPRYAHYKTRTDQVHGSFRDSLKYMTASREFSNFPNLNNNFVQILPSVNNLYRMFNATGEWEDASPCYVDIFHNFKAVRPMSYFGNPRLI